MADRIAPVDKQPSDRRPPWWQSKRSLREANVELRTELDVIQSARLTVCRAVEPQPNPAGSPEFLEFQNDVRRAVPAFLYTMITFCWIFNSTAGILDAEREANYPAWVRWAGVGFIIAGAASIALLQHRFVVTPMYTLISAITAWAAIPALLAPLLSGEGHDTGEWWATMWYWALKPLPIDFSSPTGWRPAVRDPDAAGQISFIAVQTATVLIALAGVALAVGIWRQRGQLADPNVVDLTNGER